MKFTAVNINGPGGYSAFVEGLPDAHSQGATLGAARESLADAVDLVLQANCNGRTGTWPVARLPKSRWKPRPPEASRTHQAPLRV
jgi:predicted RNase H-like HicB family nuclease